MYSDISYHNKVFDFVSLDNYKQNRLGYVNFPVIQSLKLYYD